jgi:hypothetical protein
VEQALSFFPEIAEKRHERGERFLAASSRC